MGLNQKNYHNPFRKPAKEMVVENQVASETTKEVEVTKVTTAPITMPVEKIEAAISSFDTAINESNEIANAIAVLRAKGIEIAKPKLKWAKHSFEYREETLVQFKKMVPQLGYASIKEASEEMMREWVDKRTPEYRRRTK
jgi:hypothetical protein